MTGWTSFAAADVLAQFNDSETSAYDTARGDAGGVSLADIIGKVIQQIRQAYADGGRAVDDTDGTIPEGEKNRAVAMVRWKFLNALPSGKSLAENREPESKAAEDYFLEVARRKLSGSGGAQIVYKPDRRATRDRTGGLM